MTARRGNCCGCVVEAFAVGQFHLDRAVTGENKTLTSAVFREICGVFAGVDADWATVGHAEGVDAGGRFGDALDMQGQKSLGFDIGIGSRNTKFISQSIFSNANFV